MDYKQVILVRMDLKLPKGKLAVQAAHASVDAVLRSNKDNVAKWRNQGMKKVVLKVADLKELLKFQNMAHDFTTALISDAGKTTVEPGTITCLAIGPDKEDAIDAITQHLKIL
ncbi:peptidyl-tRNA hydrolase [Candidatus Woesearchaeota archaeon]|nr:MAG: peptidyl-tRNA hydrolase [Candidatus Woesearchaeota archaeon]